MISIKDIAEVSKRNNRKDYDEIMYRVIMYREQPFEAEKAVKERKKS